MFSDTPRPDEKKSNKIGSGVEFMSPGQAIWGYVGWYHHPRTPFKKWSVSPKPAHFDKLSVSPVFLQSSSL